jgi:hypothetical protein
MGTFIQLIWSMWCSSFYTLGDATRLHYQGVGVNFLQAAADCLDLACYASNLDKREKAQARGWLKSR